MMASLQKTKIMVATGITICVIGLGFIAMSGRSAMSSGYGNRVTLSNLGLLGAGNGECVAVKGAQACEAGLQATF